MSRNIISIFLSIIFLALLSAPTVVALVDNSVDISVFYSTSEEEKNKSEKNKDIEILFSYLNKKDSNLTSIETKNNLEYYFKKYSRPQLNLISPPPEIF